MSSPDDVRAARARRSTAWLVGLALLVVGIGLATVVVPELRDEPEEPTEAAAGDAVTGMIEPMTTGDDASRGTAAP